MARVDYATLYDPWIVAWAGSLSFFRNAIHWSSCSNVEPDHDRHGFVCNHKMFQKTSGIYVERSIFGGRQCSSLDLSIWDPLDLHSQRSVSEIPKPSVVYKLARE